MGVFEESAPRSHVMHWQHEQYIGPAYDPSRDLSPNLPSCDSSMGDDPSISSGSSCSTPSNNNHQSCGSDICRPPPNSSNLQHPPQSVTPAELCRPHSSFEHHIPKLEPIQPPGTPPTPTSIYPDDNGGAVCAGCRLRISDRFYLQAVDRRWHSSCLQCCQCRNALDGEITCFSRDGNIYCKKDYYRFNENLIEFQEYSSTEYSPEIKINSTIKNVETSFLPKLPRNPTVPCVAYPINLKEVICGLWMKAMIIEWAIRMRLNENSSRLKKS